MHPLYKHLISLANPEKAKILSGFFKTGKGEYGEGDLFLGLSVPMIHDAVKLYWRETSLKDVEVLLKDRYHEVRLAALLVLVTRYRKGTEADQKQIFELYLKNTAHINNWDLVDLSAYKIVGAYLLTRPRDILFSLAKSKSLWERRISIISTFAFIRKGEYADTLKLAEILLYDKDDLMHKAVGWVLREVGKHDLSLLRKFLDKYVSTMPRTTLRYAIEKLDESERQRYLLAAKVSR
jgi:3-methyladenine DNA glycosylase AlkD